MTELSFLIDLLLNQKMPPKTRQLVADRIREIEQMAGANKLINATPAANVIINGAPQAPSTVAAMMRHGNVPEANAVTNAVTPPPAEPVAVIAQTSAAAEALAKREQMIGAAIAGNKPPKVRHFK